MILEIVIVKHIVKGKTEFLFLSAKYLNCKMSQKPRKIVSLTLIKFPGFLKRFDVRIFTVRIFIVTSLYELYRLQDKAWKNYCYTPFSEKVETVANEWKCNVRRSIWIIYIYWFLNSYSEIIFLTYYVKEDNKSQIIKLCFTILL